MQKFAELLANFYQFPARFRRDFNISEEFLVFFQFLLDREGCLRLISPRMKKLILLIALFSGAIVVPSEAGRSGRPVIVITTTSTTTPSVSPE